MKITKMDWDLLARAGAEPLDVARTRLLTREAKGLDDAAERFLSRVEGMDCRDVLAWLAQRGPTPRELPEGVPSNAALVRRFVEVWQPEDGLNVCIESGAASLWGIELTSVEPDAWDDLVEQIMPKLRGHLPLPYDARQRADAIRSLRGGCDLFRRLCVRGVFECIPPEVRQSSDLIENYADELLECIAVDRRDAKACARSIIERAKRLATGGDLRPLWVLDRLDLLGGVSDPSEVLPPAVWFDVEDHLLSDEVKRSMPFAQYPVELALRWPGESGVRARSWVVTQVLSALRRSGRPDLMGRLLWDGPRSDDDWRPIGVDRGLALTLRAWLEDRETFDSLMRESIDRGTSLPYAWVTVVRDLAERRDGSWERAWRWIDQTPIELFEGQGGRCLLESSYDCGGWPDMASLDIDSALRARRFIAVYAPLPTAVDEALGRRITELVRALDAVIGLGVRSDRRAGARPLDAEWRAAAWLRALSLPGASERREFLVSLLRKDAALLAVDDGEATIHHLRELSENEQPSINSRPWESLGDPDRQRLWMRRYQTLGGSIAAQRLIACLRDDLWRSLRNINSNRPFLEACARVIDEGTRSRIVNDLVALPLLQLVEYGLAVAEVFSLPLDLTVVARSRISVCHERFDSLPDHPELATILFDRLEWLVKEGDDAWIRALANDRERVSPGLTEEEHRERIRDHVDGEVVAIVRRLEATGASNERSRACVLARTLHGGSKHLGDLFDALTRSGLPRAEWIEVVITRLNSVPASVRWSPTRNALIEWLGAKMTSRASWEAVGVRLINSRIDAPEHALHSMCCAALSASARQHREALDVGRQSNAAEPLDAMLMAFADVFGARARDAITRCDVPGAQRALRAIMELDAPSRAYRFVGPLRKLAKGNEALETAVEACEHLLRSDADRAPSSDNIARALNAFAPRHV